MKPEKCPACGGYEIYQDEDVLDTWFSSWLWPFATFYWPFETPNAIRNTQYENECKYFYPTSALVTAPEIIFFWVARMIMAGLEFMKDIPFKDVYIHGTVRDIEGKKMSKSLGNIIDPLDVISEYGTDALRFSLISITAVGQDVFLSKEKFEQGRNFANKIWNASRFILMNLEEGGARPDLCEFFKKEELSLINRWILSRFYSALKQVNKNLEHFQFNEAANTLYGFFWHEFCDWYLELIKPDIKNKHNQAVMFKVLEKFLRILHPFMPFVTEEIWQKFNESTSQRDNPSTLLGASETTSIMTQPLPHVQEQMIDKALEKEAQFLFNVITQIRNLGSSIEIKPEQKVKVSCFAHSKAKQSLMKENQGFIINLARLEGLDLLDSSKRPSATISACLEDVDIYLHFTGLLDIAKEQHKIKEKIKNLEQVRKAKEARIKNSEFVKKAPQEIVQKEKESIVEIQSTLKRLERMSQELR
ncbi:MAG: class I tRNA ligase family protein [Candidatus Omnitrophota bacterium]